jgi:hypothetical protein
MQAGCTYAGQRRKSLGVDGRGISAQSRASLFRFVVLLGFDSFVAYGTAGPSHGCLYSRPARTCNSLDCDQDHPGEAMDVRSG